MTACKQKVIRLTSRLARLYWGRAVLPIREYPQQTRKFLEVPAWWKIAESRESFKPKWHPFWGFHDEGNAFQEKYLRRVLGRRLKMGKLHKTASNSEPQATLVGSRDGSVGLSSWLSRLESLTIHFTSAWEAQEDIQLLAHGDLIFTVGYAPTQASVKRRSRTLFAEELACRRQLAIFSSSHFLGEGATSRTISSSRSSFYLAAPPPPLPT